MDVYEIVNKRTPGHIGASLYIERSLSISPQGDRHQGLQHQRDCSGCTNANLIIAPLDSSGLKAYFLRTYPGSL